MSVSRRSVLGAAVTLPALTLPSVAAIPQEHPREKARRLAEELSEALAQGDGAFSGPGGEWLAEIYPSTGRNHPIMFGNIRSRDWSERDVSLPCTNAIEAHRQARAAFNETCSETDCTKPTKAAWRRWRKAERADDVALIAVLAFHPIGRADAEAKAAYLHPLIKRREIFEERHLLALVNSMVRS